MTAQLTFNDEFNNLSLWNGSSGTWATTYWWQDQTGNGATLASNGEQEWYINDRFAGTASVRPWNVANGVLTLTAAPASADVSAQINGYQYTSGLLNTYHTFSQTYGYFEMRADLPAGQGVWPAFWLLPEDGSWPPELDIMEVIGSEPTRLVTTAHSNASGTHTFNPVGTEVPDTSAGYHTYAVDWEADKITWYFDGQAVHTEATPADMHKAMYVMTNLAVGGYWPGNANSSTPFPANMNIDYVRAWSSNPYTDGAATQPPSTATPSGAAQAAVSTSPAGQASTAGSVDGTAAADALTGSNDHPNYIRGLDGDDSLTGGTTATELYGNTGADTLVGHSVVSDLLAGGQGEDLLDGRGSGAPAYLNGNIGADTLYGGSVGSVLRGGQGDDVIHGGSGADWISGDRGNATVSGGAGADTFYAYADGGVTVVTDFNAAEGDRLQMPTGSSYHPHQEGADLYIDIDGGGQVILQHTYDNSLPSGWIFS
jgi:beta-glucanase (GH16 family)